VAVDGWKGYFPIRHDNGGNMDPDAVLAWARDELCRPKQAKVGMNIIYDLEFLYAAGVPVSGPFADVGIADALLDETYNSYNLEAIGQRVLKEGKAEDALRIVALQHGIKGNYKEFLWQLPASAVGEYAEQDAAICLRIWEKHLALLRDQDLLRVANLEFRQIPILLAMRQNGVRVDVEGAQRMVELFLETERTYQKEVDEAAGSPIDVDAPNQLAMLADKIGVAYPRTEKSKLPSFTQSWMDKCAHPIIRRVVEIRKLRKFRGTFLENAILGNQIDGRIYCRYNQMRGEDDFGNRSGTVIGRYSCDNPNLQQIPSRDLKFGKKVRELFLPEPGHVWVKLDYSQIEPRIAVHFGEGPDAMAMWEKYAENPEMDCYNAMMAGMTGVTRSQIKIAFLGSMYGMGAPKFAATLGLPEEEATAVREAFFTGAPYIRSLAKKASGLASERGYVRTILGRRRHFSLWEPADNTKTGDPLPYEAAVKEYGKNLRRTGTHKAIQSVICGSAADTLKTAMAQVWECGICSTLGAPLMTVHDELDFSVPAGQEGENAIQTVKEIMESALEFKVPLLVDVERGPNWGEVK
jgi:DNA polymerase I-like protein with 3'-5' exonuclease and polymerase domains